MKKPFVTVMMSVFNEEKYVKDAIESILKQTYWNFELIIINDYSTDRSLEICESISDQRIRIYSKRNEQRYLAASRNIATGMARGEYIINQDADDLSDPNRIEKQLSKALENPGRRVVGCSVKRIENGVEKLIILPETHLEICRGFRRLYNRTTIVPGTILAPKKVLQEIPYRTKLKFMQDWDHTLRLYESGDVEFYNFQEPLYTYFIRLKGVVFNPEWLDCNIYVRNCQARRKRGLEEFESLEIFLEHLNNNPLSKIKWIGLKKLIELRLRMKQRK